MLLVAEGKYRRAGVLRAARLIVERRVDGPGHYREAVSLDLDSPPQVADALLMRFTKNS
jgi:hypothetical protein